MKRLSPDWEILGIPGLENMPALRWKMKNLEKLAVNDQKNIRHC